MISASAILLGIVIIVLSTHQRFFPGGHASFYALANTFVRIVVYFYYLIAAMGPQ